MDKKGWQNYCSQWEQIPFEQLDEYTYVGGESICDIPTDAKSTLCFTTKSGDHVRLQLVGAVHFILTKEFLDMVKTHQEPVPGFPRQTYGHKMVWLEVDYTPTTEGGLR